MGAVRLAPPDGHARQWHVSLPERVRPGTGPLDLLNKTAEPAPLLVDAPGRRLAINAPP